MNMTVKMSFGAFWFHIDDDFFCGECLYSSGVLLIIITQLADNFDVISPAACGGPPVQLDCLESPNVATRARGEYSDTRPGDPSPQDHDSGQGCEA